MIYLLGPGEQQSAQLLLHLLIRQIGRPFLGHDHQVGGGQSGAVPAKEFPQEAFHSIPLHRFPEAPGDHQPQTGMACAHGGQDHAEMGRVQPLALGLGPKEILTMAEPRGLGKTGGPFGVGVRTGAEHRRRTAEMGVGVPHLRPRGVSGLWPGGALKSGARPGCSSVPKTRGCGPGAHYGVDRCVLTSLLPYPRTCNNHFINHLWALLSRF